MYTFAHYFLAKKICKDNEISEDMFDIKLIMIVSAAVLGAMIVMTLLYNFRIPRYILFVAELAAAGYLAKKFLEFRKAKTA